MGESTQPRLLRLRTPDSLENMIAETDLDLRPPWGTHAVPGDGEVLTIRVGPLTTWVRGRGDEVWLAHSSGDWTARSSEPVTEPPPENEAWVRWPIGRKPEAIRLTPVFPPSLLVVKPELSFRLAPGADARIYVSVPLWARVGIPDDPGRPALTELPTVALSDTWWGEFDDGELGLWLPTRARRSVGPEAFAAHRAVCPLDLSNDSGDELEVAKVALRPVHLSLFLEERGYWSDVTRVRYRGSDEGSEIRVTGNPPQEADDRARRVSAPREPLTRGLRAQTFSRLKALSGLGGI